MGGRFLLRRVEMSEEPREGERSLLRRVAAIVRSWDGPNSRIGLEMDLTEMPWGPFDALGKRLDLLLPVDSGPGTSPPVRKSQIEQALRHVEHAADRCGEFARLGDRNQEFWLRSQETWEWIRGYLTTQWVDVEVDQRLKVDGEAVEAPDPGGGPLPALPGAASTLQAVANALRATPLSVWKEAMGPEDENAPTREEAIQTLLGVARILSGGSEEPAEAPPPPEPQPELSVSRKEEPDPDQVSYDFARGYDEGYQMGRRVGRALGARKGSRQDTA